MFEIISRQALRLVNGYWNKFMFEKYGKIIHIFDIPKQDYQDLYKKVCKALNKTDARLRRIGTYKLSHKTFGEKMSFDIMTSIVEE